MRLAYPGYRVLVSEGGRGTNRTIVKKGGTYNDYAGSTILGGIASKINYDLLTAAHEFGHQVGLRWMDTTLIPPPRSG